MIHIIDCLTLRGVCDYMKMESDLDRFWDLAISVGDYNFLHLLVTGMYYTDDEASAYLHKYMDFKISNALDIL
jgi:hypothetical protein